VSRRFNQVRISAAEQSKPDLVSDQPVEVFGGFCVVSRQQADLPSALETFLFLGTNAPARFAAALVGGNFFRIVKDLQAPCAT
jgi:hypothetical protein